MPIVEMFQKLLPKKKPQKKKVTPKELRLFAQTGQYQKVIDAHEGALIEQYTTCFDVIGYCYYQLTNYHNAINYLQKALWINPDDYFTNLFFGICLKYEEREIEAIKRFIDCLNLSQNRPDEILDHLLPLVCKIEDQEEAQMTFQKISKALEKFGHEDNPYMAKVLFYQKKDNKLTPNLLKDCSFCRIYSGKELSEMGVVDYHNLGDAEKLRFVKLESGSDVWVDTCNPYFATIKDAQIMSGSSLVRVDENKIWSDTLADKKYGRYACVQYDDMIKARRDDALLVKNFVPDQTIETAIMLSGSASHAYGHWFAEYLPKLRFLLHHPHFSELPIIVDEGMPASHYDFLNALVKNPTFVLSKGQSLKVNNLVVAPTDTYFPTDMIKHHKVPVEYQSSLTIGALKFIGEKIRDTFGPPQNPNRRIFLSRRNTQWRKLLNEQEIIEALKKYCFETIFIEDYNFAEQVQLFQDAEFIVAPNGSALNNLIFSHPSVKCILLGQRRLFNWGGWFGSFMELGYSPIYLAGDSDGEGDEKAKHLDYTISISDLRQTVTKMLN